MAKGEKARRRWRLILFELAGVALIAVLIYKLGASGFLDNLRRVGWRYIYVLAPSPVWFFMMSVAWGLTFIASRVKYRRLFMVRMSGEAVNIITPLGFAAGDPFRYYLLKRQLPRTELAAALIVDRAIYTSVTILTILSGLVVSFFVFEVFDGRLKLILSAVIFCLVLAMVALFFKLHGRIVGRVVDLVQRIRKRNFSEDTHRWAEETDEALSTFVARRPSRLAAAFALHVASKAVSTCEIWFAMLLLDVPAGYWVALMLNGLTSFTHMIFFFIPSGLGVVETSQGLLFHLMKFDPAVGVTIQLLRRGRSACWVLVGFIFYQYIKRTWGSPEGESGEEGNGEAGTVAP